VKNKKKRRRKEEMLASGPLTEREAKIRENSDPESDILALTYLQRVPV